MEFGITQQKQKSEQEGKNAKVVTIPFRKDKEAMLKQFTQIENALVGKAFNFFQPPYNLFG